MYQMTGVRARGRAGGGSGAAAQRRTGTPQEGNVIGGRQLRLCHRQLQGNFRAAVLQQRQCAGGRVAVTSRQLPLQEPESNGRYTNKLCHFLYQCRPDSHRHNRIQSLIQGQVHALIELALCAEAEAGALKHGGKAKYLMLSFGMKQSAERQQIQSRHAAEDRACCSHLQVPKADAAAKALLHEQHPFTEGC